MTSANPMKAWLSFSRVLGPVGVGAGVLEENEEDEELLVVLVEDVVDSTVEVSGSGSGVDDVLLEVDVDECFLDLDVLVVGSGSHHVVGSGVQGCQVVVGFHGFFVVVGSGWGSGAGSSPPSSVKCQSA